jgi:hypothetical protein
VDAKLPPVEPVTLFSKKDETGALTTFDVGIGWYGDLVFNEGTYYPPIAGCESREVDEYLVVAAEDFPVLARQLGCDAEPVALLAAVAERAKREQVGRFSDAEALLERLGVRARRDTWYAID